MDSFPEMLVSDPSHSAGECCPLMTNVTATHPASRSKARPPIPKSAFHFASQIGHSAAENLISIHLKQRLWTFIPISRSRPGESTRMPCDLLLIFRDDRNGISFCSADDGQYMEIVTYLSLSCSFLTCRAADRITG
jgi:hypothetical protein